MDVTTLQSKTRKRHIVQARQLAMFFAKKLTKASLANIGQQIGHRDHATVLHACKTVDNLAFTDKQFRKYVEDLTKNSRTKTHDQANPNGMLGKYLSFPLAHGIMARILPDSFVDSAGTGSYHIGSPPDPRSIEVAKNGIDIRYQSARQFKTKGFWRFRSYLCYGSTEL